MKEFTSIEAFKTVIKRVRDYAKHHGKPLPVLKFEGYEKIHGSNGSQRLTKNKIQPQSRSRIIDIGNDNMGFALFCAGKDNLFRELESTLNFNSDNDVTIFGEWCGPGIQKGVAVAQLENKQFIIFKAYTETTGYVKVKEITDNISEDLLNRLNNNNIYFINQGKRYEVEIDFSQPEIAALEIDKLTLSVENESPWGMKFGISGTGEGICWEPLDSKLAKHSDLWFKAKGLKHKKPDAVTKTLTEIDVAKVQNMRDFVQKVLPEWRLEQGISEMQQNNIPIQINSISWYLKWVCQDVLKEETDLIVANGIVWKEVSKFVTESARNYYFNYINNC